MEGPAQQDRRGVAHPAAATRSGGTLLDLVESRAAVAPDQPVLLAPGRPALDYRGLADQIRRVADALAGSGIGRGDVVAVSIPDGPELAVAILGAASCASAAPISAEATPFEIEQMLDDLSASAAVVLDGADHPLRLAAAKRHLRTLELISMDRAGELAVAVPAAPGKDGPRASDVAVVLHTSGTTARPKQVPLTHERLVGAAGRVVDSLHLAPEDRCLEVMPLIHSHGLIGGLLSSLRAGGSVACAYPFDPREAMELAAETRATWTTASPAVYRSLLEAGGTKASFRLMRSASAPMPPDLAASLEDRFGAPLIEAYGLTEAYQVAANPLPPGERRFGTVGRSTGTEVGVVDAGGNFLDAGETGEIVLRGPGVFGGYRAPQAVNDLAFLRGWFRTGDSGVLDEDGYLKITGRLREIINRGGEKIAPREVEEALGHHPAIREVVCFPVPDARLGEEVGALVVPAADAVLHPRQLRRFAAARLAPTKVPRWFWLRDRIPMGGAGKLNRLTLAETLKLVPGSRRREALPAASLPPATVGSADVRAELRSLWMEILALEEPPRDGDRFFDVGGTSLGLVELMVAVERKFGVRLRLGAILEAPSLGEQAAQIQGTAGPVAPGPGRIEVERDDFVASIVPIRTTGSRPPFFLVSPAGGSVLPFYRLADSLGREQPCYGLEISLRRRGLHIDFEVGDIAGAFLEGMRRVGSPGPWRLGGWSFGGFVAWEMAARLRSAGEEVSHVVLVDTDASQLGRPVTFESAVRGAGRLAQMIWHAKPFLRDTLHVRLAASLRGDGRTGPLRQALMNLLWKAGIERADIAEHIERDPRLLEVRTTVWGILRNLRHYLRAKRRYRPPAQREDLDLIRAGRIDRGTPRRVQTRRTLGWERYATGPLHLHRLTGNHFTILGNPHVDELAGTLNRIFARD